MDENAVSPPLSLQVAPAQADQIYLHTVYFFDIVEEMSGRGHFGEWELMVILALMRLGDDA
jgi:hypothetical protein